MARRQQRSTAAPTNLSTNAMPAAEQVHTVSFGVDGTNYEIDLTAGDAAALRQDLTPWVVHARATPRLPSTRRTDRPTSKTSAGGGDTTTIREWARAHGHTIADRGRLPTAVRQAYQSTH